MSDFVADDDTRYKDPTALVEFPMNWTKWLAGDTIVTAVWSVPVGVTHVDPPPVPPASPTTTPTVWIDGGTAGEKYEVACTITTAGHRTDKRTFWLVVRDR